MTMELLLGIIAGVIFGLLLQKAQVLRFEKQVGFLCFKDMTIIKFMLSAIIVGMVGMHLLSQFGMIELSIKATNVGAQLIGGILFGIGWAIAGYCPGTSVGAVAEGRTHAFWAVLGMLFGAAVFSRAYPFLKENVLTWGSLGKVTIPQLVHLNAWIVIAIFTAIILLLFKFISKKGL